MEKHTIINNKEYQGTLYFIYGFETTLRNADEDTKGKDPRFIKCYKDSYKYRIRKLYEELEEWEEKHPYNIFVLKSKLYRKLRKLICGY